FNARDPPVPLRAPSSAEGRVALRGSRWPRFQRGGAPRSPPPPPPPPPPRRPPPARRAPPCPPPRPSSRRPSRRSPPLPPAPGPEAGALATLLVALVPTGIGALVSWDWEGSVWPFLLAGLLAPGGSQIMYVLAIRDAGPSRTAVLVGMAPLVSVTIALTVLAE